MKNWDRFWPKVDRSAGPTACWPWTASTTTKGYGNFRMSRPRCMRLAHRVAFFITTGTWPRVVRHSCDNPLCCNPAHLRPGNHKDNTQDMDTRGRRASRKGAHNHNAILDEGSVQSIRIRAASGAWTRQQLAAHYGVSRKTIDGIISRDRWRHL